MLLKRRLTICYAMLVLTACGQAPGPGQASRGSLQKSEPIRLTRTEDGYQASLLFQSNRALLSFDVAPEDKTSHAKPGMDKRIQLWRPLLDQFFREHNRSTTYLVAVGEYPELGSRIAAAALCSGQWNLANGRPRAGSGADAVKEILRQGRLTPEIDTFFDSFHYRVEVAQVENVIVCPWARIQPAPEPQCRATGKHPAQAPCAASILFRITAKE